MAVENKKKIIRIYDERVASEHHPPRISQLRLFLKMTRSTVQFNKHVARIELSPFNISIPKTKYRRL